MVSSGVTPTPSIVVRHKIPDVHVLVHLRQKQIRVAKRPRTSYRDGIIVWNESLAYRLEQEDHVCGLCSIGRVFPVDIYAIETKILNKGED